MIPSDRSGRCLCGGVAIHLRHAHRDVGICHCATCRRWTSGPWMSLQAPDATIAGDTLTVYRSSRFAERGFCRQCGTHIFHRPQDGEELAVSAGLFAPDGMHVAREIFCDAKPPFYRLVADSVRRSSLDMALEWLPRLAGRRIARWLGRGRAPGRDRAAAIPPGCPHGIDPPQPSP